MVRTLPSDHQQITFPILRGQREETNRWSRDCRLLQNELHPFSFPPDEVTCSPDIFTNFIHVTFKIILWYEMFDPSASRSSPFLYFVFRPIVGLYMSMHVQNQKYGNFVSNAQHKTFKTSAVLAYGHAYII